MTDEAQRAEWNVVLRPYWTPVVAYTAAILIVAAHVAGGLFLKVGSSGMIFRPVIKWRWALGLILAGAVLLFTHALRIGAAGISVRNLWAIS
ncbi:hypothetical protein I551_9014 [Mycobacterium ulcerans str. Harvey]|uniref:Uncharacterized protein n=1 Tax=Mycobacterium ulcerans str. Harvey TaxID=1299332 RepID=A0ABN0R945_MYCUL|nr:hypothetical protein I551_9014 [Mycobacterium ulcerans str. Harvey]